jgi:hypothetical protein
MVTRDAITAEIISPLYLHHDKGINGAAGENCIKTNFSGGRMYLTLQVSADGKPDLTKGICC